jgi:hypothetical protein
MTRPRLGPYVCCSLTFGPHEPTRLTRQTLKGAPLTKAARRDGESESSALEMVAVLVNGVPNGSRSLNSAERPKAEINGPTDGDMKRMMPSNQIARADRIRIAKHILPDAGIPSVVTPNPANGGHLKTGQ